MQHLTVKAPGRINLIGEHTDYNEGFVMPAAIQKAATVYIEKREDSTIHLFAEDLKESYTLNLDTVTKSSKDWANYIIGVIAQFQKVVRIPKGFTLRLKSDVPIGAGLSSSAAIECAVAFAINELFSLGLDRMQLTKMAQKAEHEYAGVLCGIMDQFASMFGKKDQVILLDCKTMHYQYYPLKLSNYDIVLLDTQIKHALASSEYNTRRAECEQGISLIQQRYPSTKSLREVSMDMLNECVDSSQMTKVYNRCKYVIEEIERTQAAAKDLQEGQLAAFGQKMFATHDGLSLLYEVSCPELDFLVKEVKDNPNVIGARMMGGGFGGCTINLIKKEATASVVQKLVASYHKTFQKNLLSYEVNIDDGASILFPSITV
ncbi:MAG: galactokinase [Chitinophagaceae bacterium]